MMTKDLIARLRHRVIEPAMEENQESRDVILSTSPSESGHALRASHPLMVEVENE